MDAGSWSLRRWLEDHNVYRSEPNLFELTYVDEISSVHEASSWQTSKEIAVKENSCHEEYPFVRSHLLDCYRQTLMANVGMVVIVMGHDGVGKTRLMTEIVKQTSLADDVTVQFLSVPALYELTEIRTREQMLQWLTATNVLPGGRFHVPFNNVSAFEAALEIAVPKTSGKSVVMIEDVAGFVDTVAIITKLLLMRDTTTVTFALPAQTALSRLGLSENEIVPFHVWNYNPDEAIEFTTQVGKKFGTPKEMNALRQIVFRLYSHPLANAQAASILHNFGPTNLIKRVDEQMLAWTQYNIKGVFPSVPIMRPSFATTTIALGYLQDRPDRVGGLANRLLRILVVMHAALVPVLKLYHIIACADGVGFRKREPFNEAVALLDTMALIKLKSGTIQVYKCVRRHPAFRKAKEDMTRYLKSDLRTSYQFMDYVRSTLSDRDAGSVSEQSEVPQSERLYTAKGNMYPQRRFSKIDLLLYILVCAGLCHSILFTHVFQLGSVCTTDTLASVPYASPLQGLSKNTSIANKITCVTTTITACAGLKQLEFLIPTQELSIHRSLKRSKKKVTNLLLDVDALCPCIVPNRRRRVPLEKIELPSVQLLNIKNAWKCGMQFLSFNISLPRLERVIFNNGDLGGNKYQALESFLEPSMETLKIIAIEHANIDSGSIAKLRKKAQNLSLFTVNKETIVPSKQTTMA